jgi:N-acetylneuraminic acid mutarotase
MDDSQLSALRDALCTVLVADVIQLVTSYARQALVLVFRSERDYGTSYTGVDTPYQYDASTDKWAEAHGWSKHSVPTDSTPAACALLGRTLYVAGASFHQLNLVTQQWRPIPRLPTALRPQVLAAVQGKLYAIVAKGTLFCFDPSTGVWNQDQPMRTSRWAPSAVVAGPFLYVIGTTVPHARFIPMLREVERYDASTETWSICAQLLKERCCSAVAAPDEGTVYVCGGTGASWVCTRTCEVYHTNEDRWLPVASMTFERRCATAACVDGDVMVCGGMSGLDTPLVSVERYDPRSDRWSVVAPLPTPVAWPLSVVY